MLSFMSDRRVLAVSAALITAAIFLFLLGTYPSWKAAIGGGFSRRAEPPPMAQPVPAEPNKSALFPSSHPAQPAPPEVAPAKQAASSAVPAPSTPAAAATPAAQPQPDGVPSFDIVRVEPTGDSVIAARAKANSTVVLLDQGHPIARAQADAHGQVAFVPPVLAPGEHSLMLSLGEPDAPGALSSQSVAVSVPERAKAPPMVALLQPEQPTKLLSSGAPVPGAGAATGVPPVSIGAIDVEEMGSVFATGRASPGSQCRVYLNGSFVAGVTAGSDGTWSLKIERGMRPGHYSVRVDELASAAGDVRARAEVPFDYPARATASMSLLRPRKGQAALPATPTGATPPAQAGSLAQVGAPRLASNSGASTVTAIDAAPNGTSGPSVASTGAAPNPPLASGVPTVVAQLLTTKVIRGDSLWRISRKMLGHGRRYTQIYAVNTSQIRDPRLIYPGQIFVMPQTPP